MSGRILGLVTLLAVALSAPLHGAPPPPAPPETTTRTVTASAVVDTCVDCHLAQSDRSLARQVTQMEGDAHHRAGLSCHHCHGGDPTTGMDDPYESMDPSKGYVGIPARDAVAPLCGRCHADVRRMTAVHPLLPTDQFARFTESAHGKALARGDKASPTCTTCHRAHGVFGPRESVSSVHSTRLASTCGGCHADPASMAPSRRSTAVVSLYLSGRHARASAGRPGRPAAVCHDCHGSHSARRPQAADVAAVCGRCHATEWTLYRSGRHGTIPGFKGCIGCHSAHDTEEATATVALWGPGSACARCHEAPGPGRSTMMAMAAILADGAQSLEDLRTRARDLARRGGGTVGIDTALAEASGHLTRARQLVHSDSLPPMRAALVGAGKPLGVARRQLDDATAELEGRPATGLVLAAALFVLAATLGWRARW